METSTLCPVYAPSPAGITALKDWRIPRSLYAGYFLALDILILALFVLPGFFMLRYGSDTLIGFLISLTMLCFGIFLIPELTWYVIEVYPAHASVFALVFAATTAAFVPLIFLFPDGRFAPRWTAIFAVLVFLSMSSTAVAFIVAPRLYADSRAVADTG